LQKTDWVGKDDWNFKPPTTKPNPVSMAHLTFEERIVISEMRRSGASQKDISKCLGRSPSTICRELQRNAPARECYRPDKAHRLAVARSRIPAVASKLEQCTELYAIVTEKLNLKWSPEQISGWLAVATKGLRISHQTIYRFLYSLDRSHPFRLAMRRRGRRNRKEKPGFIKAQQRDRVSIHDRPQVVQKRQRIGDWELDLMTCHRVSGYLITAVERMTGYTLIRKVATKSSDLVMKGILKMFQGIDRLKIKTFTFDNGTEFYYHSMLRESLNVQVYFADPYNSGQRGTNENTNGLFRQYFPKTLDYGYISNQAVVKAQDSLNTRPRLRLGFQTPASQFK
jgi:transposase, IS30 family